MVVSLAFPSCQLVVVVMGFCAIACCLLTRVNLSVAVLSMVNYTYVYEVEGKGTNSSPKTSACFSANDTVKYRKVCEDECVILLEREEHGSSLSAYRLKRECATNIVMLQQLIAN